MNNLNDRVIRKVEYEVELLQKGIIRSLNNK